MEREKLKLRGKMRYALHLSTNAKLLSAVSQAALLLCEKKHSVTHLQTAPTSRTPEGSRHVITRFT